MSDTRQGAMSEQTSAFLKTWAEEIIKDAVEWHNSGYTDDRMLRVSVAKYVNAVENEIIGRIRHD